MHGGRSFLRGIAALLALSACGVPSVSAPAAASTPPLSWQQLSKLHILCLVGTDRFGEREAIEPVLCDRIRALAAEKAPMPVEPIAFGDPALIDPANATLLVHAAVQQHGDQRLLVFSMRPYRAGGAETDVIFGGAPRAVTLSDTGASSPALDAALRAALSDTLPWQGAR